MSAGDVPADGTDPELAALQASYPAWQISRTGRGHLTARQGGYQAVAPTADGLRRSIAEWDDQTGPNGTPPSIGGGAL